MRNDTKQKISLTFIIWVAIVICYWFATYQKTMRSRTTPTQSYELIQTGCLAQDPTVVFTQPA